ncbi:hypothetical protein GUJ93_ZPchr0040g33513 [Zizania palustris]|uniref:Knottins-like domain-containing protein n=1 Tax=Zizania palustris TaxID=103762 RepID=A0A8J5V043_ZIZPA|nr:hypothetical protein GUJ93_ZPchr0040g33513 [Zizania palustris]
MKRFYTVEMRSKTLVKWSRARGSKDGRGCAVVSRSKTFTGDCKNENDCYDACVGEGYNDGYCFLDVDTPYQFVCTCASHCPPPPSSTTRRKKTTS